MYQSVEGEGAENIESSDETDPKGRAFWVWLAIILGVAILIFVTLTSSLRSGPENPNAELLKIELSDYRTAMSDRNPALRRARLTDFVQTYPGSRRRLAAQAQLDVLNAQEANDWAQLTYNVYDPDVDKVSKSIALDRYTERWGQSLIGNREDDVVRIQGLIETNLNPPDESEEKLDFTPGSDQFAANITGDQMAGGAVSRPIAGYRPPSRIEVIRPVRNVVTEAKIRKAVEPRYPSRALRREIPAIVTLSLYIDDEGEVEMTEVVSVQASRYARDFVKAAERAARRSKFEPKRVNGQPVATRDVIKRYRFVP